MIAEAISLPVVSSPASPGDRFRCAHWNCVLAAKDCVARQQHRKTHNGESAGHRWTKVYTPLRLQFCASGACEQGKAIAAAVGPKSEGAVA